MKIRIIGLFILTALSSSPEERYKFKTELTDLNAIQFTKGNMIDSFFKLKHFYDRYKDFIIPQQKGRLDGFQNFFPLILRYLKSINNFYTKDLVECLRMARQYGSIRFASFLLSQINRYEVDFFHLELKKCFEQFDSQWKESDLRLFIECKFLLKGLLEKPFKQMTQPAGNDIADQENAQKDLYNAEKDWEERKKIIHEITRILKLLHNQEISQLESFNLEDVQLEIIKYEFIACEFQVDSNGSSYSHFISVYYELRRLVQLAASSEEVMLQITNLYNLFGIYCFHLSTHQLTETWHFPKMMLATVLYQGLPNELVFYLFKLPYSALIKLTLENFNGDMINFLKSEKIYFTDTGFGKSLLISLLNSENSLKPKERWFIQVYVSLCDKRTGIIVKAE
jgi:hypothetical protein